MECCQSSNVMNIANNRAIRPCTSCQMCSAVCPTGAITISLDADGFYRPLITEEQCINCELCTKVCYKFDSDIKMTSPEKLGSYILYAAAALDDKTISATTSGGIADILAKELIKQGYICTGVIYDNERNIAKGITAATSDETDAFRGSKYIQSYSEEAFKELVSQCKTKKIAVFGTPCQIYAIHKFACRAGVKNNLLLIDLYCHGCPTLNLWKKHIQEIVNNNSEQRIASVNFRSKIKGWGSDYHMVVNTINKNNNYVIDCHKNKFYTLFFSNAVLNEACTECKLRSTLEYTDIRLGDFWGPKYIKNRRGISAVTLITEKGKKVFDAVKRQLWTKEHSFDDFIEYQSFGQEYNINKELRTELLHQLASPDIPLQTIVNHLYKSQSTIQTLKRIVKQCVMLLPIQYIQNIKSLYYKLLKL